MNFPSRIVFTVLISLVLKTSAWAGESMGGIRAVRVSPSSAKLALLDWVENDLPALEVSRLPRAWSECRREIPKLVSFLDSPAQRIFCRNLARVRMKDALLAEVLWRTLTLLEWNADMGIAQNEGESILLSRREGRRIAVDLVAWRELPAAHQAAAIAHEVVVTLLPERNARARFLTALLFDLRAHRNLAAEIGSDLPMILAIVEAQKEPQFAGFVVTPFGEGAFGSFNHARWVGRSTIAFAPLVQVRVESATRLSPAQLKLTAFLEMQSFSWLNLTARPELFEETFCQVWGTEMGAGKLFIRVSEYALTLQPDSTGQSVFWSAQSALALRDSVAVTVVSYSQCLRDVRKSLAQLGKTQP